MRFGRNPLVTTPIVTQTLGGRPILPPVVPIPIPPAFRLRDWSGPFLAVHAPTSPGYLLVIEASGPQFVATSVHGAHAFLEAEDD